VRRMICVSDTVGMLVRRYADSVDSKALFLIWWRIPGMYWTKHQLDGDVEGKLYHTCSLDRQSLTMIKLLPTLFLKYDIELADPEKELREECV
jgi:hypothetical protein